MRHSPTPPSSWTGYKELGKGQFERGDYETALTSYSAAINPELNCPASERQIVLSNMVACRLKIGGPAHARAAVDNAKQVRRQTSVTGKLYFDSIYSR
jgi:Tfp pilus assembly protein PilF